MERREMRLNGLLRERQLSVYQCAKEARSEMSVEKIFTRENMDYYLKELAKEFWKRNSRNTPDKIILVGGAAILANYGFRDMTYDIDAVITASSAMKEAVNAVVIVWIYRMAGSMRTLKIRILIVLNYHNTLNIIAHILMCWISGQSVQNILLLWNWCLGDVIKKICLIL